MNDSEGSRVIDHVPVSAAEKSSAKRADEMFLAGARSRVEELVTGHNSAHHLVTRNAKYHAAYIILGSRGQHQERTDHAVSRGSPAGSRRPESPSGSRAAVLETNPKFVEAFMVGLNTEMSHELLWRGFPTDQRGTYFRDN